MREIAFFERVEDYRDFLFSEIFREPLISEHPFYRRLIGFVADERSPLFYRISHRSEHFGFSGSFHFMTRRESYKAAAHESLFFLHDFTHLLFPYPHSLHEPSENWHVTQEQFTEAFFHQERLASNESEILVHYRVGEALREKIFPGRRLYIDVLRERGIRQLSAPELLKMRALLCNEPWLDELLLREENEITWWFRRWAKLTPRWCADRYAKQVRHELPQFDWHWLDDDYEQTIAAYEPRYEQALYERNILQNLQLAYALLDLPDAPAHFSDARAAVERLDGEVFFVQQTSPARELSLR